MTLTQNSRLSGLYTPIPFHKALPNTDGQRVFAPVTKRALRSGAALGAATQDRPRSLRLLRSLCDAIRQAHLRHVSGSKYSGRTPLPLQVWQVIFSGLWVRMYLSSSASCSAVSTPVVPKRPGYPRTYPFPSHMSHGLVILTL